ncbi:hypothetical protein MWLp12_pA0026 (plasmid) [Lactiplantibacillus plantarum]|nr:MULTISPECIES: hypothetical protein [Lactobacillaceae]WCL70511.1 hypothetical protein MWLp12_pA0026 [Lactiplantibacillus plantarum]
MANTNQQLKHDNKMMQSNIKGYKSQLVDTIVENAPTHKVEPALLKPNEVAQPANTDTGRQQHLRQTLKYLTDTVTKVLRRIKIDALSFINQPPKHLQSAKIDPSTIQASKHPFDYKKELQLENNPIIKLKKAILMANNEQLQKANDQTKQSLNKQADNEWEF